MFKTKGLLLLFLLSAASVLPAGNLINVSWGDNIMVGSGISQLDTPQKIRASLKQWKDNYDGELIIWRLSSEYIRRFYEQPTKTPFYIQYEKRINEIMAQFDPIAVVDEAVKENGQKFLPYCTIFDHGAPTSVKWADLVPFPWQDRETIAHPEYQEKDLEGNYHYGVLDLSIPESRAFMIKRLVDFVDEYKADGIYVCTRTHSNPALHADQFGFGPEIVKEYQKRYGIDITKDPRFDYRSEHFAPNDPALDKWRKLRGEYFVTFMRELREKMGSRIIYLAIPRGTIIGAPYGNMFVDKETLLKEKIVDGMVLGVISSRGLYGKRTTPHKDLGYLESNDDNYNLPSIDEEITALKKFNPEAKFYFQQNFNRAPLKTADGIMFMAPAGRATPFLLDAPELNTKNLLVEAFIKISPKQNLNISPRVISKYNHGYGYGRGWEIRLDKGCPVFRTYTRTPQGLKDDHLYTENKLETGKWYHLAAVFDSAKGERRFYIDGKEVAKNQFPAGSTISETPHVDVILGNYNHTSAEFKGALDEVRISDSNHFAGVPRKPYTGKEPGTLALWHFDAGDGNVDAGSAAAASRFTGSPVLVPGVLGNALSLE